MWQLIDLLVVAIVAIVQLKVMWMRDQSLTMPRHKHWHAMTSYRAVHSLHYRDTRIVIQYCMQYHLSVAELHCLNLHRTVQLAVAFDVNSFAIVVLDRVQAIDAHAHRPIDNRSQFWTDCVHSMHFVRLMRIVSSVVARSATDAQLHSAVVVVAVVDRTAMPQPLPPHDDTNRIEQVMH